MPLSKNSPFGPSVALGLKDRMNVWFSKKSEVWKCDSCSWQRPLDAVNLEAEAGEHRAGNRGHLIDKREVARPEGTCPWWLWVLFPYVLAPIWLLSLAVRHRQAISGVVGVSGRSPLERGFRRIVTLVSSALLVAWVGFGAYDALFWRIADGLMVAAVPWVVFYALRWVIFGFTTDQGTVNPRGRKRGGR